MGGRTPLELIEHIASTVVLAESLDEAVVSRIKDASGDLRAALLSEPQRFDATVIACLDELDGFLRNFSTESHSSNIDVADDVLNLKKISALIFNFQKMLSTNDPGPSASQGEDPSSNSVKFQMPDWLDDKTFDDFLSVQKHNLEEIEKIVISLEKGDPDLVASLSRNIHTMKGEAGVMGLEELGAICHATEDFIGSISDLTKHADVLFRVVDWIDHAISSYAKRISPQSECGEVKFILSEAINAETKSAKDVEAAAKDAVVKPIVLSSSVCDDSNPNSTSIKLIRDADTVALIGEFLQESEEGLAQCDTILIGLEKEGATTENINAIFRAFHTIKGVSGFLNLEDIRLLAHEVETLLNKVRQEDGTIISSIIDLLFDATEAMRRMFNSVRRSIELSEEISSIPDFNKILRQVRDASSGNQIPTMEIEDVVSKMPIGEILQQTAGVSEEAVKEALDRQWLSGAKVGEQLMEMGVAVPKQVAQALRVQKTTAVEDEDRHSGRVKDIIKVDADRLDRVVDMIGELVIAETMVQQLIRINIGASRDMERQIMQLDKITRELQEMGTSLRMIPVRATFQRMMRLGRDVARKAGKSVEFAMCGEDTDLDKSVVDMIGDPLVHMIRNAVDHGLELSKEERRKAGKREIGRVELRAFHKGGSIFIEIEDDGRGLNRAAILDKAREKGFVKDGSDLSDKEVWNFIFEPGFSTAAQITDISGRGVGMDVVRRSIEDLRGHIDISSELGVGTTFSIKLPLTLAIIDGMVVRVSDERYIIPTLSVVLSLRPDPINIHTVMGRGEMMSHQGEIIPLIRLADIFSIKGAKTSVEDSLVVVVEDDDMKVGIIVDELICQQQIVIKNLGEVVRGTLGVSGGAIMPDGRVGLILDVSALVGLADMVGRKNSIPNNENASFCPPMLS